MRREPPARQWLRAAYVLMAKFSWTLAEMKALPLSSFMELHELMKWEQKEVEKEQRKVRR